MRRKIWLFSIPIIILATFYGILKGIVFPMATEYANNQLLKLSNQNDFAEVQFEKIDFEILDPRIKVKNIKIKTKEKLSSILKDFEVKEVDLKIDLFELILGKLNFNILNVDELKLQINLDSLLDTPKSKTQFQIGQLYEILNMIPIQRLKIDNINLNIFSLKYGISLQINKSFLRTSYLDSKFLIRLGIEKSIFKNEKNDSTFPLEFNTNLLFSKTNLLARELLIKIGENKFRIEGLIEDVDRLNTSTVGRIAIASQVDLQEVKSIVEQFGLLKFKEKVEGKITLGGAVSFKGINSLDGHLDLNSENMIFDKFLIGTAIIKSEFKKNKVKFSNVELLHPAGKVKLAESSITLKEPYEFKTNISSDNFDLYKLLVSLNLKKVPVYLELAPHIQCEGSIAKFSAFCKVETKGHGLKVLSDLGDPKSRIVEVEDLNASGEFFADSEKIAYKGEVAVNENTIESEGIVEFLKGFDIKFKSPKFDFKNIASLANLDFKGALSFDGSTQGNSHSAVFGMKVLANDFSLEKYNFGQLESMLQYEDGNIYLKDMRGSIDQSKYNGSLDINLRDSEISGAVDFDSSRLKDILFITKDIVPIPFAIDGLGNAKVSLSGPLNFWKMDYKLEADFKDIEIHTEKFTNLKVNLKAKNGNAQFLDSALIRRSSRLSIEGTLNSDKTFNLNGTATGFKLEESDFIKGLSVPLLGDFNFQYTTLGPITDPRLNVLISLNEILIGEKQLPPSHLKLLLTKEAMEWDMKLFNEKITSLIRWPFNDSKYVFNSQFNNFDFTVLFPFIGAESIQDDYGGNLTGQTTLTASSAGLKDLDGKISIDDLKIQRDSLQLNLAEKSVIQCHHGEFSISELKLLGPENIVELSGENFTFDNLNVRVSAKSDLRILHFLAPFLEEISGPFEMGARVSGSMSAPRILGQALLKDSYVKIKNFPHPFEKLSTTLVFSQSKIFVQNVKSNFAGGNITSDGQIEIRGPNDIPLFLSIKADNVSLNVPDKIRTSGSANLVLSGKWFPFLLAGTYNVSGGVFEKELGAEDSVAASGSAAKQSIYLPKSLKEKSFDPLALDINVFLDKKYLLKNSLVEGYLTGNIQIKGALSNILIFGKVEIEKGTKLYFKDKIFELQNGLVNFTSLREINPEVYITANSRVSGYDINLLLQGPAKTANAKLTSSPPLAQNDIISLLTLGVTSQQLDQNVQSNDQAAQTGNEIGAAVLSQSALTKNLKTRLGLDIQFVNQFDSTKNISVLKATATKKLSTRVQATASRALSTEGSTEVKVQYFFNKNVSAIGNWEGREAEGVQSNVRQSQSIFGLDLEFKREFR